MSSTRFDDFDVMVDIYEESEFAGREIQEIWLDILEKYILPNIQDKSHILDLCCGRGKLLRELKNKGYRVTGIDGSDKMLDYARENAPGAEFILGDARFFELQPTFHTVVSTDNCFSYTLNLEELKSIFHNVWASLLENGWFAFDLVQEELYEELVLILEEKFAYSGVGEFTDNLAGVQRHNYNPEEKIARYDEVLFKLVNGSWQRLDRTVYQRAYSPWEIQSVLEEVGFTEIRTYDAGRDLKFKKMDGIMIYICRKPLSKPA